MSFDFCGVLGAERVTVNKFWWWSGSRCGSRNF